MMSLTIYDALTTFTATVGFSSLTYLFFSSPASSSVMDLLSPRRTEEKLHLSKPSPLTQPAPKEFNPFTCGEAGSPYPEVYQETKHYETIEERQRAEIAEGVELIYKGLEKIEHNESVSLEEKKEE